MSASTAEGTTAVKVETTAADGSPVVIEGEIVGPAGEENSSPGTVAVPAPAEVITSDLTKGEARKLADRIKRNLSSSVDQAEKMNKSVEDAATLMIEAYSKRIWLALDEESWEDFVSEELGEVRFRLDRAVRQSLVYRMREEAHMSQRAIAPVFGIDQKTVSNDVRQMKRELGIEAPTKVVGKDGKVYDDGDKPTKVKPIEQRFTVAVTKCETQVNALFDLSTEDGFAEAAGTIAKANRADLAKLIDSLKAVQERLQNDAPDDTEG